MPKSLAPYFACILALNSTVALTGFQVHKDQSSEIIDEPRSKFPKGAVLIGKDLPAPVKSAVRELVALSREQQTVEDLTARVIAIRDMNRFLDYKGVRDARQRDLIKRFKTAFTLDEQWPIYLNGESDLIAMAETRSSNEEGSAIYKLAAVIAHERIHAQGEASERKAIEEEIRILEVFVVRRLVELDWLVARKAKLAQLMRGQLPDKPLKVRTADSMVLAVGSRAQFILSRVDQRVVKAFENAWRRSGEGIKLTEAVVLIFRMADDSIKAVSGGYTNQAYRFTFPLTSAVFAIVHTHPNKSRPEPEEADRLIADRSGALMFTITLDGMYLYDPTTKKITKVHVGLDWLKPSRWATYSRLLAANQQD